MQFFASVSYIKPFFLILVSLCVVMFQWLSDVVLFLNLSLPCPLSLSFSFSLFHSLSHSLLPVMFTCFVFYHIVKLTPSSVTTHYAVVLTKHSKYTSECLYVYYCVAQVDAWQLRKKSYVQGFLPPSFHWNSILKFYELMTRVIGVILNKHFGKYLTLDSSKQNPL